MALFQIHSDSFAPIQRASFVDLKLKERSDLQRLLKKQIEVLDEGLYVLDEEFGDWEDSKRRIDLLAIDEDANLVVVELKRTNDGGHMELQALRYAAMISSLTFNRVIDIHARFLAKSGLQSGEAEARILKFLGWNEPDEDSFASDVRILLVSEDFGIELTTTVLWLRESDIDIRCIRMRPYAKGPETFVDVQQIIPLPEAEDYMVQMKDKRQESLTVRRSRREHAKYRVIVGEAQHECTEKGRAILTVARGLHALGITPDQMRTTINQSRQRFYEVTGISQNEEDFIIAAKQAAEQNDGKLFDERYYFTGLEDLFFENEKTFAFSNQWRGLTDQKMRDLIAAHGSGEVSFERME